MQEVGLEEYTLHEHLPTYSKIVQKFHMNLEPAVATQPVYTIVKDKVFSFTRDEILKALPIPAIEREGPSFSKRVNATSTRSQLSRNCVQTSVIMPSPQLI